MAQVIACGVTSTGDPKPLRVNASGQIVAEVNEALTPLRGSASLTTLAIQLSASISGTSLQGWLLKSTAAWLIGDSGGQEYPVAANEPFRVPSSSLVGWYAKTVSGSTTLIALGAGASS